MKDSELAQAIKEVVAKEIKVAIDGLATTESVKKIFDGLARVNDRLEKSVIEIESKISKNLDRLLLESNEFVKDSELKESVQKFNDDISIIKEDINKSKESAEHYSNSIVVKIEQVESDVENVKSEATEKEIKHLELITENNDNNSKSIDAIKKEITDSINSIADNNIAMIDGVKSDITKALDKDIESIKLSGKVYIQDELLRVNDHINQKLNTLKGDKGDSGKQGEKGDTGNDGDSLDHKGDYVQDEKYKKLNLVIHNGTTFIAMKDTSNAPPGDDWRAVATKGSKGNKGSQGERGMKGETGISGKDGEMYSPEDIIAIIKEAK